VGLEPLNMVSLRDVCQTVSPQAEFMRVFVKIYFIVAIPRTRANKQQQHHDGSSCLCVMVDACDNNNNGNGSGTGPLPTARGQEDTLDEKGHSFRSFVNWIYETGRNEEAKSIGRQPLESHEFWVTIVLSFQSLACVSVAGFMVTFCGIHFNCLSLGNKDSTMAISACKNRSWHEREQVGHIFLTPHLRQAFFPLPCIFPKFPLIPAQIDPDCEFYDNELRYVAYTPRCAHAQHKSQQEI
jgi:hypothetical protein